MRRDFAVLFGVPFLILVVLLLWWSPWRPPYVLPTGDDLYATVSGVWDWDRETGHCAHPHEITFDSLHHVMMLTESMPAVDRQGNPRQIFVYDITEHAGAIRGQIRGERRTTGAGKPVVWDLVLRSHDSYEWRRTDLHYFAASDRITRCRADQMTPAIRAALDHPEVNTALYIAAIRTFHRTHDPEGRVWGVSADPNHYLASRRPAPGPTTLFLLDAPDTDVTVADSTDFIPGGDHIELITRAVGGREVILAEPTSGTDPLGLVGFEIDSTHLRPLHLPRVELAGPNGPESLLDKVTLSRVNGRYQLQVDGDLIVDPGTPGSHFSCRIVKLAGILLLESAREGWTTVNGKDARRCDGAA